MSFHVLISAGGTGGHIFPGIALAHALKAHGWTISWMGSAGGMEEKLVQKEGFSFYGMSFKGMRGKGMKHAMKGGFSILQSVTQAVWQLKKLQPDLVVGLGGYPSMPGVMAGHLLRIPIVLHESNRVMGLANRIALRWATTIATSFSDIATKESANYSQKMVHTGTPLRQAFEVVQPPFLRYQHKEGPLRLLIVGGSQGASILNQVIPQGIAYIPEEQRPVIVHQSGKDHFETLKEHYKQHQVQAECVPFIEDMLKVYEEADVVICRAGALTVAELLAVGVPAFYVPLPFAADQPVNAKWCDDHKVGWYQPQATLTSEGLAEKIMSWTREELARYADRAYELGIRDGTARLVDVCEQAVALKKK